MPQYLLKFRSGGRNYISQPVEADNPRQAMKVFRGRYYATLKGWSNFEIMDKIGVIKDDNNLTKPLA